jgi:hypothetical protein
MVFADWVKDLMFPFDWTNRRSRDRLLAYPWEKGFVVEVMNRDEKILIQKYFKTMDESVKYAKDYMKKY